MPFKINPITGKLDLVNAGTVTNVTATTPLFSTGGATPNLTIQQADATHNGYLSASDWSTFNNKQDRFTQNYITNSDAEIDTSGWNLYNDAGRTDPAYVIDQDLTYTSALSGDSGNGVQIEYIYNASFSSATPNINVISGTHVQVRWNNGPTIANNPTATQLKAAWDAVPAAVAIATVAITGTASNRQYINGSKFLANGGDASPVDGTGGVVTGVTFTRNTATPLIGIASFDLAKDAANREGTGVSTDFVINSIDKNTSLQISFLYQGSTGIVLGTSSDVRVFIYDINNAALIPVTPLTTLAGPVNTPKQFTGLFTSTTSSDYRLILHITTISTTAWDLLLDSVIVTDQLDPTATTEVPSVVLQTQPISGAVTDHMVVMWRDGATSWVPATIAGAAIPVFGTDKTMLGFATNIIGLTADIYVSGSMDGFSFGPFLGYNQYIDNTAGQISPLPSPFTDTYVRVGKGISDTVLNIDFDVHVDLIANGSGTPLKGGLLSNSAVNDATGDQVLTVGTNGNVLIANSAQTLGLQWAPAVVTSSPLTYTTATRTLAFASQTANFFFAAPNGGAGVPSFRAIVAADIPTLNQNTTGSAAKWTTPRLLANNSVDGSANVAFANKFIVQGTTDAGLSAAQFLGALGTGIVKNTTTTGVLSIAVAGDFPTLNQNTTGSAATLTTPRTIAGTSFNGSANIALANKFIVQGTTDAGLSGPQFLGALATGIVKNTTTTGVLTIAVAGDFPTLNQNTTGTASNVTGIVALINGGTGTAAASANAAFNALSPMTTLGDIIYEDATPKGTRLAGNTTTAKQYLSQTGNGSISAAPAWATIASNDVTNNSTITGTTVTDALNTIGGNFNEVYLKAIKNAGAVTANTEIPTWTTVVKDTNSAFNSTTGTFTVPVAGDYEVSFTAAETLGVPTAQVYFNGSLVQTGVGSLTRTSVVTTIANAAVNDTIWVALDTTGTLTSNTTDNILTISKIVGPGTGPVNARYHSSTTTITSSLATITYTTKDFDTQASAYSAGVYTVPSAGKYIVKASLSLTAATAAAGNNYDIIIRKNSTEIARFKYVVGAATQKPNTVVVEDLVSCAVNDTIDIQASAAGTTPSINASTTINYFYINKESI